ncbi:ribonuclease H-like domain-containing protein [Tanacetum coccineum]
MAMNHLTTFVPEKLNVDAMNYSSCVYYFSHLCHGYGILDHLVDPIFSTLAPSLRKRLVDLNPTTAKDAWTYIEAIFQDNKRPRAMALKAELRNLKLGDLFIDGYFQKIESIVLLLNGLGSPLSNDDVVTFTLEGLTSTYETISTVISRVQNPLIDATSASPMVLLAKSNTSAWRGPSLEKVNNPCWSFVKGSCRFGDACKYLHNGVHGKSTLLPRTSGSASSVPGVTRSNLNMFQSLLAKFGLNAPNISTPSPPVAYTVSVPPGFQSVSAQLSAQPTYGVQYPTGSPQQGVHYPQQGVQTLSGPPQGVHLVPGTSQPPVQFTTGVQQQQGGSFPGSVHLGQSPSMPFHPSQLFASGSQGSGQATLLPNAFNTTTLQEPAFGNWNMDTCASSHLNDSVHCLSDILNMCIYPSVAVGDGRFIPVTNSGHSVLSTPFRPLHLNNGARMVGCNSFRTPVDTESKLGDGGTLVVDPTLYRSLAGSLQYLTFTRPDITYVVQQVCLYMHDPREPHFSALKRILRYVQGTLDYGLQLFSSTTDSLIAYSDADWAGCPTTRRSTSGYCVFLGNNLLSWSSKRQPTLSRSSAEAEYRGVANAVAETCWIRNLLRELHTPLSSATIVYCDNVSAVYLSSNPVQHQRTKHIEIDIHFVRDLVATGQVRVLHVPSRFQYADIFTKGLPSALFDEFRDSLSVRCTPAPTAGEC